MISQDVRVAASEYSKNNGGSLKLVEAFLAGFNFKGDQSVLSQSDFEDFWNLYDKKRGKPKCISLWKKLSAKDKSDIMAYIPSYKESQPDKQYRKDPQTFLRNRSWEDELIYGRNTYKDRLSKARAILE